MISWKMTPDTHPFPTEEEIKAYIDGGWKSPEPSPINLDEEIAALTPPVSLYEPFYVICTQFTNQGVDKRVLHRIKMSGLSTRGGARELRRFEIFQMGKRKGATKKERETYRDRHCWREGKYLYRIRTEWDWLESQIIAFGVHGRRCLTLVDLNERYLTPIEHDSLSAFFEYIGFDYKKKTWIKPLEGAEQEGQSVSS